MNQRKEGPEGLPPALSLAWEAREGRTALKVSGWTPTELDEMKGLNAGELGRRLALVTTEALDTAGGLTGPRDVTAIAGRFDIAGDSIYFVPRFPCPAGMGYSLLAYRSSPAGTDDLLQVWPVTMPPAAAAPRAFVEAIYPDVGLVPVNLLKIYVQFSEPMSEGRAQRSIRVSRADTDEPLEGVFVPMDPELWDPHRRRLTLLLDPARIKHGLVPNMEAGYPLIEGVPFRLSIDDSFRDARGAPLRCGTERVYEVGPETSARIDLNLWTLKAPTAGSQDSLVVEFDRPLDYALLQRCLRVNGPQGAEIAGNARPGPGEGCWLFRPERPWAEGPHQVVVERFLEDLAGNSPVRIFDRDLYQPEGEPSPSNNPSLDFYCSRP